MGKFWSSAFSVLLAGMALVIAKAPAAELAKPEAAKKIKVLVLAGGHPYAVKPFRAVFDAYADMACTFVEEKTGGEAFEDIAKWPYDAVVLYNYEKKLTDKQRDNFLKLLDRGVGLVILHHGIYAYRSWPEFQKIVGVTSWLSGAKDGVAMRIHVEDPKHPITQGLNDFSLTDEAYQGHGLDPKVHVLLSTDAPGNAKAVAWVHTYRKSPVCYFQLGHDSKAYSNAGFAKFLGQAIRWTAGRLKVSGQKETES